MLRISYVFFTFLPLLLLITNVSESYAQRDSTSQYKPVYDTIRTDTLKIIESELPKHSPTRATLYSTFVPGLGQAYNRKYWKIPVIYAGMGVFFYFAAEQH